MEKRKLSRRELLRLSAAAATGAIVAACAPAKPQIIEVEKEVPVEKVVKETVIVEKEVVVEKPAEKPAPTPTMELSTLGAGKTKIDFWIIWSGVWREAMLGVAKMFVERNPEYTVNVLTSNQEKFLASVAGGNPPDAFTTPFAVPFAARGAIQPIDDLLATSSISEDDYDDEAWEIARWRGKTYGVPCIEHGAIASLIWNKELFEKAGLDPEKPPRTLDEVWEYSEKLYELDDAGNIKVIGFDPRDGTASWYWMWAALYDKPFRPTLWDPEEEQVYIDHPFMVDTLNYIKSYYDKYGPEKFEAFRETFGGWTGSARSAFNNETTAMLITGSYAAGEILRYNPELSPKVGYTWIPAANGRKIQSIGGWCLVLPKGCKHPEAAIKLAETFSTFEGHDAMRKTCGSFGALIEYFEKADFSEPYGLQWYTDSILKADRLESRNLGPTQLEIHKKWQELRDDVVYEKITPQEGLKRMEKEIQESLAAVLEHAPQ